MEEEEGSRRKRVVVERGNKTLAKPLQSNETQISFSKEAIVTGLNLSANAEELSMAGDMLHFAT